MTDQALQLSDITDNLISEFDATYLSTNLNVLKRLIYETQIERSKLTEAFKIVINEVIGIWEDSSITVKRIDHCKEKLQCLYKSYTEARKFQNKPSKKVNEFLEQMTDVFDISKDFVIKLLGSMDDKVIKEFLSKPIDYIKRKLPSLEFENVIDENILNQENVEIFKQSSPPKSVEPGEDISQTLSQNLSISEAGSSENANVVSKTDIMTELKAELLLETQQLSSEETNFCSQSSGTVYAGVGRYYESKNERGTINVMTPEVVAAFDKAKVSDRDAVLITDLIANALNVELQSLILNRKSINIARAKIRKQEFEKMKQLIKDTPVSFLIVHWDGKLISDDITCKKVDRLPILVSSDKFTKLINVPALQDQKANTTASAIYASLKDWGLVDLTKALCCDTINVNLGSKGGTAVLLEKLMEKDLLYSACRRHVCELILRATFEVKFPGTSGPDVPMFRRFREKWSEFDLNSFENGLAGLEMSLKNSIPQVIQNIQKFLTEQQPRNDYRELLELCLIFLGVEEGISFEKPGAIHHARWMAKAIYSIKIYLFRKSFNVSKGDEAKLYAIFNFIVFRYLTPWYNAPLAISAPNNDLKLVKSLIDFKYIDKDISDATLHKFRNHLWYLSPELCILSLFDTDVDITTKQKIVESLQIDLTDDESDGIKKFDPSDEGIRALESKTLDYFTNSQSLNFFKRFNLNDEFLKYECNLWENNLSYIDCREKLKNLTVVNDCAERAINLAEEYVNTRSHDEQQKQYLLQFVDESRKNLLASTDKKKLLKKLRTE